MQVGAAGCPPLTSVVLDPALVPRQVVPGFKGLLDLGVGQLNDPCEPPAQDTGQPRTLRAPTSLPEPPGLQTHS